METSNAVRRNKLDIAELAEFDKRIAHFPASEQKQKRLLYLKQAADEQRISNELFESLNSFPFGLLTKIWPFKNVREKQVNLRSEYFSTALEYWQIPQDEWDRFISEANWKPNESPLPKNS